MSAVFIHPYLSRSKGLSNYRMIWISVMFAHANFRYPLFLEGKLWSIITNNDNYSFVFHEISILHKCRFFYVSNDRLPLFHSNNLEKKSKELITHFMIAGLSLYNLDPILFGTKMYKNLKPFKLIDNKEQMVFPIMIQYSILWEKSL